jgi:hypothetical protein
MAIGENAMRVDEPRSTSERKRAVATFEGPERSRHIMIIVAAVAITVFALLYATDLMPGI